MQPKTSPPKFGNSWQIDKSSFKVVQQSANPADLRLLLQRYRSLLQSLVLAVATTPEEERGLQDMVVSCKEYVLGMGLEVCAFLRLKFSPTPSCDGFCANCLTLSSSSPTLIFRDFLEIS